MGDLAISLQDMAKCMKNLGIMTSLDFCPTLNLEPELILLIMKTLEGILVKADFRLSSVVIQISNTVSFEITGTDLRVCFPFFGRRIWTSGRKDSKQDIDFCSCRRERWCSHEKEYVS